MPDDEKSVVMSLRVGSANRLVSGSELGVCALCGHNVWISPSSKPRLAEGWVLQCKECTIPEMADQDGKIEIQAMHPEQIQEVLRALKGL